ncbi:MAG: DUF1254 domain-containing protein [Caulobacteraceae bacterium]
MSDLIRVTPDNFTRAESDMYFAAQVKDGAFGRFHHLREPADVRHQSVVAMNRDTLYSVAVFDLDAGPVTITLPDPEGRFMSMEVINEDQYALEVVYGGVHTLTRDRIGTRYVHPVVRTLVDPNDPKDIAAVHALQDAIVVRQANPGRFETPSWDPVSQKQVRDALDALGKTMTDSRRTFGPQDKVDPVRHLIGTAIGWGGNPDADAYYIMTATPQNDGKTVYRLRVPADVPVDGFWSISVYDKDGYFAPNEQNAYSVNSVIARKDADGSVTVQFGGQGGTNLLPVTPGWKYCVRLYRPRPEILNGAWIFPEPLPAQ